MFLNLECYYSVAVHVSPFGQKEQVLCEFNFDDEPHEEEVKDCLEKAWESNKEKYEDDTVIDDLYVNLYAVVEKRYKLQV